MRNIWHIFKSDWIHILRVPTGIFLIAAIIILPGLYDWINVKSVWDPYNNTQGIKIAVTSLDEGAVVNGLNLNMGATLIENLKGNNKLGWTFVDEHEAYDGVMKGTFYASLLVPADFSSKITGIIEGKVDRPEVIYTINEKVNAIAPKITGSGVSAVAKQINESFTESVSEVILSKLSEANIELQNNLPMIRRIEDGIFALESDIPTIEAAGQKVFEVESRLPEINDKAQKIVAVQQMLPEISEAANYVLKLQQYWPQISQATSEVLAIQQRLPQIQEAADRIQEADANFDRISKTIEEALVKTNKALEIVTAAQSQLEKIGTIATTGIQFTNEMNSFLTSNKEAFQSMAPAIKQNLILLNQIASSVELISAKLTDVNIDTASTVTVEQIDQVLARLSTGLHATESLKDLLGNIGSYLPGNNLTGKVDRINSISKKLNTQIQLLNLVKKAVNNNETPPSEAVSQLNAISKNISSSLDELIASYDSELVPAITGGLDKLQETASVTSKTLQTAQGKLPDIAEILASANQVMSFGQGELQRLQTELPDIRAKVHEMAENLKSKTEAFTTAINIVAPFVQNELPKVGGKIDAAASFVQNDLPKAETEIGKVSDFVTTKLPEVQHGVHRVAGLVRDDLPLLEAAIKKAAATLRDVNSNNNIDELARLLRGDIQKESEFLASPVQIKENQLYPIPNYGSAMMPFYCVLALWVGSTLLISLLRAEAENPTGSFRGHELYLGRMFTFMSIGLMQAVCISLGNFIFLDTYVANKYWFVVFALLVSAVFVSITYMLLSVFGNIGKGLAIVFMVLQFSSSGGTFPISMSAPFFQVLNPFMPFTYAISLLREAVGGILWQTAIKDMVFLIVFMGISLFFALALKRPLSNLTKRSAENAKKTKIIA
ncbi:YhgE/Pip domain-containing protein [Paenibacillus segetis]|uniref:Phage infection protein n=1 Tax=Paenibacillus segetis TaxID=1325360 RepID=A0ABQ1YJZ4_9BACL|nr:YhgE/Pip domain-containing protein [Paenibacillus segetis]GGH28991.1 phage infection protein [Paenibacillus segetis]